jgi:hypothetical protein
VHSGYTIQSYFLDQCQKSELSRIRKVDLVFGLLKFNTYLFERVQQNVDISRELHPVFRRDNISGKSSFSQQANGPNQLLLGLPCNLKHLVERSRLSETELAGIC